MKTRAYPRNRIMYTIGGLGLGAGLMFVLDPARGARRRALARDHFSHWSRVLPGTLMDRAYDLRNRLHGIYVETADRLRRKPVADDILTERVWSSLGHVVEHPHYLLVTVNRGQVTLAGATPSQDIPHILHTVAAVRGVTGVRDHITPAPASSVPEPGKETTRRRERRVA
jgi:hypothetical protein